MAFAVIETGGKQYRVSPGTVLSVEKLEAEEGSTISFSKVLMYQTGAEPVIGTPLVEGITVTAEVLGQIKGTKIRVFTYKPKKRQRRTLGHRQQLTQIKVTGIGAAEVKKVTTKTKKEHEAA